MWLANARRSPRNAPNVRPRARPITDLLPDTRIIEILPRLNPPLPRHLLQSRHRRLVPPPRPVQRRPLLRWPRLAPPLIRRRRLAQRPNRQVNPSRSAIRDPHFSTVQGLDEVGEAFPANLDSDTEQDERREPEKDDGTGLSQGSG
jgi:hypothetical protein